MGLRATVWLLLNLWDTSLVFVNVQIWRLNVVQDWGGARKFSLIVSALLELVDVVRGVLSQG